MMNFIITIQRNRSVLIQLLSILLACLCGLVSFSQSARHVALGDKYFEAGDYYTAAGLYEQYLHPSKKEIPQANFPVNPRRFRQETTSGNFSKTDILYKQAESYRLANYLEEAAKRYKECYDKEPGKYINAMFWYGVCQRELGNYNSAEESINTFIVNSGTANALNTEAQKELATIKFIRKQISRPDTIMYQVKKTNTVFSKEKGLFGLNNISGNKFMYTSTVADSSATGVSPYHSRLFTASIENGILENVMKLNIDGADLTQNQGAACLSADRNILYFTQWKKENGKNISSIYYAIKENNGWAKPSLLASINKEGYSSKQPFCSADGKTIYFASDMPGGSGGFDIWSAQLQWDGTAIKPVNLGAVVNTPGDEQAPYFHSGSNTLVFASDGRQGMGGFDLFSSTQEGSGWNTAENLGYPVNSSRDDIYFTSFESKKLLNNAIVGSDRGAECCLEAYSVIKAPKKMKITGIVLDCKTNQPAADAEVVMQDAPGGPFKITTGPDGKFSFDIDENPADSRLVVNKENYIEKTETVAVEKTDETNWQIDILHNKSICIEEKVVEKPALVIKAENVVTVFFDFDKSNLKPRGIAIMDSIYQVLTGNPTATIQVSGYTDGLGSDAYNQKLSDRRARTCANYLIKKGIDKERISFVSFGKCCPVEMEIINGRDNPDGRSKNRRALINISKDE